MNAVYVFLYTLRAIPHSQLLQENKICYILLITELCLAIRKYCMRGIFQDQFNLEYR